MTQGTRGSRSGRRTAHAAFGFAPLALIAACVALWACALLSAGPAGAAGIQVTQCTGDPSQQSCDKAPTTVQPAKPAPRPAPKPAAPAPKRTPAEVHDYSLTNGKGKVQTPDGRKKADTLKVSVSPSVNAPPAPPKAKQPPPPAPGVAAPVSTTGGVPASGIASPFSMVSADQALSQFEIPPFLVPIYLAAGRTYGIPWNVLASINRIETDFGRNLSVSSAGALGWMQFMPGTWKSYGVDASGDGVADPYNPVDAVYAAARYLRASGGATDLRKAIFSYNHANWYVDEVLLERRGLESLDELELLAVGLGGVGEGGRLSGDDRCPALADPAPGLGADAAALALGREGMAACPAVHRLATVAAPLLHHDLDVVMRREELAQRAMELAREPLRHDAIDDRAALSHA
jgi:hypothetical protein